MKKQRLKYLIPAYNLPKASRLLKKLKTAALCVGILLLLGPAPGFTGKALAVDFTLNSWEVANDSGYPSLLLIFDITDTVEMRLIGPNGIEADYKNVDEPENSVYMHLAGYWATPEPGTYELLVTPLSTEEIIFREEFTFRGADLSIVDVEMGWKLGLYYEIEIDIDNHGDLPVYPTGGTIRIENEEDSLSYSTPSVMPGERETLKDEVYISVSSGIHPIDITLTDYGGDGLAFYSGNVVISDDYSVVIEADGGCFIGTICTEP